jgi:uncharacterized pyridoxal phosphate-containing UPF0001 family protein
MTIAPFTEDIESIRQSFRYLRELRDEIISKGYENVKELIHGYDFGL